MIDRTSLRLSAALLAGQLLYIVVTQFHSGRDANDHPAIFATYADSGIWKAVHVIGLLRLCDDCAAQMSGASDDGNLLAALQTQPRGPR